MCIRGWKMLFGVAAAAWIVAAAIGVTELPTIGAGGLLHPARRHVERAPPQGCTDAEFAGVGLTLKGWRCRAGNAPRGTIVYLHGIADNRTSAVAAIER